MTADAAPRLIAVLKEALHSRDPRLLRWPARTRPFHAVVADALQGRSLAEALQAFLADVLPAYGSGTPVDADDAMECLSVLTFRALQLESPRTAALLAGVKIFERSNGRWTWHPQDMGRLREADRYLQDPVSLAALILFPAPVALDDLVPKGASTLAPAPDRDALPKQDGLEPYRSGTVHWYGLTARLPFLLELLGDEVQTLGKATDRDNILLEVSPAATSSALTMAINVTSGPDATWQSQLWLCLTGTTSALKPFQVARSWQVKPLVTAAGAAGLRMSHVQGETTLAAALAAKVDEIGLEITRGTKDDPALSLGEPDSALHVRVETVTARVKAAQIGEAVHWAIGGKLAGTSIKIRPGWLEGLGVDEGLSGIGFGFDLDLDGLTGRGLRFNGASSGGVDLRPEDWVWPLGAVTLRIGRFQLGFRTADGAVHLELRLDVSIDIKDYLHLGIDGVGAFLALSDPAFGFVRPQGFALQVTMDRLVGGGLFHKLDLPTGPGFEGALKLKLSDFSIAAVGRYERTSTGHLSAVLVLGMTFSPGITLPYGLMIVGVGGAVGINRRLDQAAVQAHLSDGSAAATLFCDDPVRDSAKVLPAMAAMFTVADGSYVFGPTVQITWAKGMVTADLGVLVQLPELAITIIGRLRLPGPDNPLRSVIRLRLDVNGNWSLADKSLTIAASVVDSTLFDIVALSGDSALGLGYGSKSYFYAAVGGFRPGYTPPAPANLPPLRPMSAVVDRTYDDVQVRFQLDGYFALTPASLQFGASARLTLDGLGFHLDGDLRFDAFIGWDPPDLEVALHCKVDASFEGVGVGSIDFTGRLLQVGRTGPLLLPGRATAHLPLGFSHTFEHTVLLREGSPTEEVRSVRDVDALLALVESRESWHDEGLADALGHLRADLSPERSGTTLLLTAANDLSWSQQQYPLAAVIERVAGSALDSPSSFEVTIGDPSGPMPEAEPMRTAFPSGPFHNGAASRSSSEPQFFEARCGSRWPAGAPRQGPKVDVLIGGTAPDPGGLPFLGYASRTVPVGSAPQGRLVSAPGFGRHDTGRPASTAHPIVPARAAALVTVPELPWSVLMPDDLVLRAPDGGPPVWTTQAGAVGLAASVGGVPLPEPDVDLLVGRVTHG